MINYDRHIRRFVYAHSSSPHRVYEHTAYAPICTAAPKFPFSRPSGTNPPVEYAKLRQQCPLSQVRLWDDSKMWMVVRHKDVCDVLDDPKFSKVSDLPAHAWPRRINRQLYMLCRCALQMHPLIMLHLHLLASWQQPCQYPHYHGHTWRSPHFHRQPYWSQLL